MRPKLRLSSVLYQSHRSSCKTFKVCLKIFRIPSVMSAVMASLLMYNSYESRNCCFTKECSIEEPELLYSKCRTEIVLHIINIHLYCILSHSFKYYYITTSYCMERLVKLSLHFMSVMQLFGVFLFRRNVLQKYQSGKCPVTEFKKSKHDYETRGH